MSRIRSNFQTGQISIGLNSSDATITWSGSGPNVSATGSDYIPIVLNPAAYGSTGSTAPEIVWISGYTAGNTSATIQRGKEGTTASSWSTGTAWALAVTKQDFTLSSGIINGDFPAPTVSGQLLSSTDTANASWTSNIPTSLISGTFNSNIILPLAGLAAGILPAAISTSHVWNPTSTTTANVGPVQTGISGYNNYIAIAWSKISYSSNATAGNINLSISGNGTASINAVAQSSVPNIAGNASATTFAFFTPGSGTVFSVQCVPSSAMTNITAWSNYLIVVGLN